MLKDSIPTNTATCGGREAERRGGLCRDAGKGEGRNAEGPDKEELLTMMGLTHSFITKGA